MQAHLIQIFLKLRLLVCFFFFTQAQATPFKDFVIKHLESEQLPQSTVAKMLQDKYGYWWIITNGDISRYDGFSVKTFTHENLTRLNTQIIGICKNDNGDIIAFDQKAFSYQVTPNGLQLCLPKKGTFWQPAANNYLAVIPTGSAPIHQGMVPTIIMPKKGIYVSAYSGGRGFYYQNSTRKIFDIPSELEQAYDYSGDLDIFEMNGRLCKITASYKIDTYDSTTKKEPTKFIGDVLSNPIYRQTYNSLNTKILYANHVPYLLMAQSIYSLAVTNGNIDTKLLVSDIPSAIRPISLGIDSLNNLIAIGTISNGIYFLQQKVFHVRLASNEQYLDNVFYGVLPLKNNWYYSSKGFTFKLPGAVEYSVVKNIKSYQGIFSNKEYNYFSFENQLIKFAIDSHPKLQVVCPLKEVMVQMENGPDGQLWLCTKDDIGIIERDTIVWKLKHLLSSGNNTYIECFKFINKNEIFIGTGGGLYIYQFDKKILKLVPDLRKARVRNIIEDKNNCYWLCTYGQGLYYYAGGKYYHYDNPDLTTPHTVLKDNANYLWISSNNGLFKINYDALTNNLTNKGIPPMAYRYSKEDGFFTNEFNGGCHPCEYKVSDSLFLFPSMNGLIYFNPLETREPFLNFPIFLDGAEVNSSPQPFPPNTILPFGFQNATFTISTPYYGNIASLRMEYIIKGYDKNWQPIRQDRQIQLKGLPNGNYTLLLRKRISDINQPYSITSLPFSVATPFWKTPEFYFLLIVICILTIYIIFKLILLNILRRKQELRTEVAKRTKELEHSLDQLSQSNQKLMDSTLFREQILSFVLHDIRTPLKYISRISESLYKNHKQMDETQVHEHIGELHESTIQFTSFSEGFLQWINTHSNRFHLNKKTFDLHQSVAKIYAIFSELSKEKNILLINNIQKETLISTDETILGIIIRNIIDNAIKYTASGNITATAICTDDILIITITDTGMGMTDQELAKLKKNISDRGKSTSGGLGMLIVNDMLTLLKGSMEIDSRAGVGTTVRIKIKLK